MLSKTTQIVCAVGVMLLAAGCQTAHVRQAMPEKAFANDTDTQMEFWHAMNDQKLATNDEAFHGLLLYFYGSDAAKSYADRVALLKSKHMLAQSFNQPANAAVTRGTLSIAIAKGMSLKGGVMYRVTGGNVERYATRELQSEGVYPVSSPNQLFSGPEFVGIIGKLDDYQHGVAQPITNRLNEQ